MLTLDKIDYFPGYCQGCNEVVQMNLKDELSICPYCKKIEVVPYNNPELIDTIGKEIIEASFDNVLTNGTYFCPKCRNMSLKFISSGLFWD